ncbi:response regulator [Azospirillum doebereinerae]
MFSIDAKIESPGHGGRRALVSDADADHREALSRHLAGRGFHVSHADGALDALAIMGTEAPNVALLHSEETGDDGDRAVALAAMLYPQTRIIVMAATGTAGDGAFPVLRRPVDLALLDRCLDELTV